MAILDRVGARFRGAQDDLLTDTLVEVMSVDGEPLFLDGTDRRPRIRIVETAIVFGDLCAPVIIGRDGMDLGGDFDLELLATSPAIHCNYHPFHSTVIAHAFGRAEQIITSRDPGTLHLVGESGIVMTLRFVNG